MTPNILCIHYNGNSTGSFVQAAIYRHRMLSQHYQLTYMLGSEGSFTSQLREIGAKVLVKPMREISDSLLTCPLRYGSFRKFLRHNSINLVYVMDFVHWKPAELYAAKHLCIPTLVFCAFYKPKIFCKSFLQHCDAIATNSYATAERIAGNQFSNKTHVIHNSVELQNAKPVAKRSKNGTIGFIGSLIEIKGIEDLIRAVPALLVNFPDLHLRIAGSERDRDGYEKVLKALVVELNIERHVQFIGHVNDVPSFFGTIDLLVVPSHDEPFGYINIEAGRSGIPVVATRVGGIPEIVIDKQTGLLISPHEPDQISDACCQLLSDEALRQQIGRNAKIRVTEHFSHEAQMPKWLSLIDRLILENNIQKTQPR